MINYRGLLRRYMAHVLQVEGAHFLWDIDPVDGVRFSAEEIAELHTIRETLDQAKRIDEI